MARFPCPGGSCSSQHMQKGHSCACFCSCCYCCCCFGCGRVLNDHKSHRLAVADEIERLLSRVTPKHIAYPPGIKNLAPGTHHMAPSDDGSVVSSALRTSISSHRLLHTKNIERLTFFSYSVFSIISLWFFLFLFYFFVFFGFCCVRS